MLFNLSTLKTELIQINNEYIEIVWSKGDEKSFKGVGIYLDKKLKWDEHIAQIAKKIGYSNYSLNKARNNLTQKAKKTIVQWVNSLTPCLWSPNMEFCTKNRLDGLLKDRRRLMV